MIAYFTGTGNSRYVAERIAAAVHDELLSLNEKIKNNDTTSVPVDGALVVVTPTYAWRIPRAVNTWIEETELTGAREIYFVMTCGGEIGNAAKYNRLLCAKKRCRYMGTAEIVMPENYIAMFDAPDEKEAAQIIKAAEPSIQRAADCIKKGEMLPAPRNNIYDRFMSLAINPVFYSTCVKDRAFVTDERCVDCGKCAELCPMNNIVIEGGRPIWRGNCTHCMACICYCPMDAIEYGKKSVGKPRYKLGTR